MNQSIPEDFRAHLRRHNRRVIGSASLMLVAAVLLWGLLYFLFYWVTLLAVTSSQGTEAAVPRWILPVFVAIAGALCGWCLIERKFWPFQRVYDRKHPISLGIDLILALPRMTISAGHTLSAYRDLDEAELFAAWQLLGVISKKGEIPIQQLPVEVVGEERRRKVLLALQLTDLVELKVGSEGIMLSLANNEEAHRLGQPHVRML